MPISQENLQAQSAVVNAELLKLQEKLNTKQHCNRIKSSTYYREISREQELLECQRLISEILLLTGGV